MTTALPSAGLDPNVNAATDIDAIWKAAIDRYENVTTTKITYLTSAKNVDDILNEIHDRESKFKSFRHDGSKTDRFRTLVSKSLRPVEQVSDILAQIGSKAFPPSTPIFTAVRYLISTANSVSADYDKVVAFFEDLDLYLHRLKILNNDVSHIPQLGAAIAEVLTSVLMLCGICTKYIKMNRIVKACRNLVSEDDELKNAYDHFHKMVDHEGGILRNATFAAVYELKRETGQQNEKLLDHAKRVHKHLEGREATLERDKILEGLSSLTFYEKQRDTFAKHHQGTGQWVLRAQKFQKWLTGKSNSTLLCYGIRKSPDLMLVSIAVNYASEAARKMKGATVCVYCDYKNPKTHSELDLLASIARQLTEQSHAIPAVVKEFREKNAEKKRTPTENEWISLIRSLSSLFQQTCVFIDALDECPEANRDRFLYMLQKLDPYIRFFFTARPNVGVLVKFANVSQFEISASNSDIEAYVECEISRSRRLSIFVAKDSKLKEEIVGGIKEKAAGMFLLARLQLDFLRGQNSFKKVGSAINTLPKGIYDTYDDAMKRIEDQGDEDSEFAKKALSYIFCAKRPLNVEELLHALAIETGDTELDQEAIPEIEILFNVSAGLIQIEKKSNIIGLVHHTLQEYFEKNPEKLISDPDVDIARACLTYLSFDAFGSGPCSDGETLTQRLQNYQFLDYASRHWGHHVTEEQLPRLMNLIIAYLGDSRKLPSSVQVLNVTPYRTKIWHDRFPKRFGPLHIAAYWGLREVLQVFLEKQIEIDTQDSYGATALHVAAKHGHRDVVQYLLRNGAAINAQNQSGETALLWAARNGHKEIAELLLMGGADVVADKDGWTALNWAVVEGHIDLVKLLLKFGIDLRVRRHALYLAADEGNEGIVQMLLDSGVDTTDRDDLGTSVLDVAVARGHEPTVRVLLRRGADVNSSHMYQDTALHWAAVRQETIASLLLENGADIHAKNDDGQTALCWAAQGGSAAVAQLLLHRKADVNVQDEQGIAPLHWAALRGCEAIAQLLLENGANPTIADKDGWTPLHGAWINRHEKLLQLLSDKVDNGKAISNWVAFQQRDVKKWALLEQMAEQKLQGNTALSGLRIAAQESEVGRLQMMLEKGANINAKDAGGSTALELGACFAHEEFVQLLLENGADVNLRGSRERPALSYAVSEDRDAIVQLLIDNGADVNMSSYGSTPIMLAAERGNIAIARSLVEAGADANIQDYSGQTAVHIAALNGREEMVQFLADQGANLNVADCLGRTPLILAIENLQRSVVKVLLDVGAAVEAKARDESTALHLAVYLEDRRTVQLLLERGANINAVTRDKFTPLHIAALRGFRSLMRLLLAKGADPEAEIEWYGVENLKEYEIHWECVGSSLSRNLSRLLLEHGIVSQRGLTARRLAASGDFTKIK
ncbi:hypothetical protein GX51_02962 [Blastomyces parvus]|uniref:Uncharacterized protein n=1 Tax=Blastomyces parvus TaxID=2060905 RepID=A0A2B7X9W5_9EURO|nr:hypothetical protein GX51_02962 [Blastomyces parvus]